MATFRLRVPLVGTGTASDPYRPDLPTAFLVAVDYANAMAVVDIPDEDLPPNPGLRAALSAITTLAPPVQGTIGAGLILAWRQWIDIRYAQHAGQYTLDRK